MKIELTVTEGVWLSVEQYNRLLDAHKAVEAIPFCESTHCHANQHGTTCHIHRLDAVVVVDNYIRGILSGIVAK